MKSKSYSLYLNALKLLEPPLVRLANWALNSHVFPVQFDITNACNLNCRHCYHSNHSNAGAITLDSWQKIFDEVDSLLSFISMRPRFILCGGEPFVSQLLWPIIEELNKRHPNCEIFILTNGTFLNQSNLLRLKEYNIKLQISLDGSDSQTHDKFRGSNTFEKTISGIKNAVENNIETQLLVTLTLFNSQKIENFFVLAKELKVSALNFTRLISLGNASKMLNGNIDRGLKKLELKHAYEKIIECSQTYQMHSNTNKALYILANKNHGENGKLGHIGIVVDYKGNLKVSSRSGVVIGNILHEGLLHLYQNNEIYRALRSGQIEKCGDCRFYSRCGGDRTAAYAATGSFLKQDPDCWIDMEKQ